MIWLRESGEAGFGAARAPNALFFPVVRNLGVLSSGFFVCLNLVFHHPLD